MADYNTLKNAITEVIRTNYNEEITGQILQDVLIGMIDALGSGYLLMGVATPGTSPGTPDANVAYLTATAGSYANFDDIVVNDEIALLVWDGSWHKQTLANAFTDTEKTKLAGIEPGAQVNPPIDVELDPSSANAVENSVITAAVQAIYDTLDTKADKNSEAPEMVVGTAQGLCGKVIAEMFTNRITGKGIVGSGAAIMTALRGLTLKWNQLASLNVNDYQYNASFVTPTVVGNTFHIVFTNAYTGFINKYIGVSGHKYYVHYKFTSDNPLLYYENEVSQGSERTADISKILVGDGTHKLIGIASGGASNSEADYFSQIFDLTAMFDAGNEPATVAEFEALYNAAYYAHNPGTLLPFKGTGLQTVEFNLWDEQWELGSLSPDDGSKIASTTQIRSKNFIPVYPNTTYYRKNPYSDGGSNHLNRAAFYDLDKKFLGSGGAGGWIAFGSNAQFTTPAKAAYMMFYANTASYENNICINRSDTARNGQYEPYHTETLSLPVTTATANNGEDVPFADGLKRAGNAYDGLIIVNGWAVGGKKRLNGVNLSTLTWYYQTGATPYFYAYLPSDAKGSSISTAPQNIICSKYGAGIWNNYVDKTIKLQPNSSPARIVVIDSAYTDKDTFEASLNGETLIYEITEENYTFDTPFPVIYSEDRDGTETVLPVGVDANGVPNTAPMDATIEYPINADQMISADSMRSYLEARKTAGEISAYTMVWNQTTQQYDFTITT